jgi:hypothetical protein
MTLTLTTQATQGICTTTQRTEGGIREYSQAHRSLKTNGSRVAARPVSLHSL